MSGRNKVPDAWDDEDWETQTDRAAKEEAPAPKPPAPLSKAERRKRHAEEQRRLWESAEAPPEELPFLAATSTAPQNIPLATPFKPAVKLLSRKPAPQTVSRVDPVTGRLEQMTIQDDGDSDDESKKKQPTPEEIRERQMRELEEKQRRYEEARAKIFGTDNNNAISNPSSGQSTPGNVTPPQSGEGGRGGYRGRGRGRGGGAGGRGGNRGYDKNNGQDRRRRQQPQQHQSQQPQQHQSQQHQQSQDGGAQQAIATTRELYDPNYSAKPAANGCRRTDGSQHANGSTTPRPDEQPIREPRGPDSSGKNGFSGFARRGAEG